LDQYLTRRYSNGCIALTENKARVSRRRQGPHFAVLKRIRDAALIMSATKRRRDDEEHTSDAPVISLRAAETSLHGASALREALEANNYAVVALDAADALTVRNCATAGLDYFTRTPDATKHTHRHIFKDAGGAGLCGYNRPHAAKEVLRLRRGGPPPPVDVSAAFDVVERCACAAWCAVAALVPEGVYLQAMGCQIRSSGGAISSSPFDLMFYPNDDAARAVPNSTPHVDSPGLVTVIPVALTPGLRVRDRSGRWRDVEAGGRPCEHVVILVDAALQALSKGALEACTHEVAKADEPRLSLVYELRPSMETGRAILDGAWPASEEEECPLFMTAPPAGGVSQNAALSGLAALVDEEDEQPAGKRRRTTVGEAQISLALL